MRVAFVTHYSALYGANRSLLDLIDGLTAYDVAAYVLMSSDGPLQDALSRRGVPWCVSRLRHWYAPPHPIRPGFAGRLRSRAGDIRARVIRLRTNQQAALKVQNLFREWGADLVYSNSVVIPTGMMISSRLHVPHVWHIREFPDKHYGWHADWGSFTVRKLLQQSAARIYISEAVRSHFAGPLSKQDYVVYNGVVSAKQLVALSAINENRAMPDRPYSFALVGSLYPKKGPEVAIRAIALLRERGLDAHLVFVGAGETAYESYLHELAHGLEIPNRVTFRSYRSNVFAELAAVDAALMCSEYEAMGRVTVEAMAACKPVIGLASGATPELIQHERNGLLYEGGPDALADSMESLIRNPQYASRLGMNGWNSACRRFTIEQYSSQIYEILSRVKTSASG